MKKTYQIEVDCANCANLMEEAAKKTEGVQDAVVNFMTQKMIVEFREGADPKAEKLQEGRGRLRDLSVKTWDVPEFFPARSAERGEGS